MSADGEIEIQVEATGAEGAAEDLAEASETDVTGGATRTDVGQPQATGMGVGDRAERGGFRGSLRAGALAGILTEALGPLLDILSPIFDILNAFLAPVAALVLRLLQPVLRLFIKLLPAWFAFVRTAGNVLTGLQDLLLSLPRRLWQFLQRLPGLIWQAFLGGADWLADGAASIGNATWQAIKSGASWLADGAASIGSAIWNQATRTLGDLYTALTSLPQSIGQVIQDELNRLTGEVGGGGGGPVDPRDVPGLRQSFFAGRETREFAIELESDISQTVENIEQSTNVDFPF